MKYIYARVSTESQETASQLEALEKAAPGAHIIEETCSGVSDKKALQSLLMKLTEGDVVYVYKLDRLSRDAAELMAITNLIIDRGAILKTIDQGVIKQETAAEKMFTNMLAVFAQFERDNIKERQRDGIKAAKARGVKFGGKDRGQGRKAKPFNEEHKAFCREALLNRTSWVDISISFDKRFGYTFTHRYLKRRYYGSF